MGGVNAKGNGSDNRTMPDIMMQKNAKRMLTAGGAPGEAGGGGRSVKMQ